MPTLLAPAETGHDRGTPEADALIAEARRRRRRRWLAGLAVLSLAIAATTAWRSERGGGHSVRQATSPAARFTAAASCGSAVHDGPLPVWARAGFHPPNLAMPYVLGEHGDIVAVLWARHDPLLSPPAPGRNNKILWVSKLPVRTRGNLQIAARRLVGGTAVGPIVRRAVPGGPGPSGIDMPRVGCWHFALRWSGHRDAVDLAYAPPRR